jgi:acyl-CoA synthetase (AMP-forming)/AMP-acid ligase II
MDTSFENDFCRLPELDPEAPALIELQTRKIISYKELVFQSNCTCQHLLNLGLTAGDPVLVVSQNSCELAMFLLSSLRIGLQVCPANPASTETELQELRKTLAPRLEINNLNDFFAGVPQDANSKPKATQLKPGTILLTTSGTTGRPKILALDIDRHWKSAKLWSNHHDFLNRKSRFWNFFPMSYNAGILNLLLVPLSCRGSVLISESFSPALAFRFRKIVEEFGINVLWFNPTVIRTLQSVSRSKTPFFANPQDMRGFLGMAPVTAKEKEEFEQWLGFRLYENYAMTECQFITSEYPEPGSDRGVGRILPYVEYQIKPLEDSDPELLIRSPGLARGYWKNSQELLPLALEDEFLRTGDLGHVDAKTRALTLVGRSKDIIKKGGLLVSFAEIETTAKNHHWVEEACVIQIPDPFWGEEIALCVTSKSPQDSGLALEELSSYLHSVLAKYKWPKNIILMECFPKTASGKIVRREVLNNYMKNSLILRVCDSR